jgi:hypothetical protein
MMPVTIMIRSSRVTEIICAYRPTSSDTRPVTAVRMAMAVLSTLGTFLMTSPSTNDSRPITSVKIARTLTSGCDCPSELSVMCGKRLRVLSVPATPASRVSSIVWGLPVRVLPTASPESLRARECRTRMRTGECRPWNAVE